jgi:hypothetical protein
LIDIVISGKWPSSLARNARGDVRRKVTFGLPQCRIDRAVLVVRLALNMASSHRSPARFNLYLIEHSECGLYQIGISNDIEYGLKVHERRGWDLIDISEEMSGSIAHEYEQIARRAMNTFVVESAYSARGVRKVQLEWQLV